MPRSGVQHSIGIDSLPSEVLVVIFGYLDGQTAARVMCTCWRFNAIVKTLELQMVLIKIHHVRLSSHLEFYDAIGRPNLSGPYSFTTLAQFLEGGVMFGSGLSFNDFYLYGNRRYIEEFAETTHHRNWKLFVYPPLQGYGRHQLTPGIAIHRGASIVVFP